MPHEQPPANLQRSDCQMSHYYCLWHTIPNEMICISGQFNVIIGFTGDSTLPEFVVTEMINIMVRFTVKQQWDIWSVME